MVTNLPPEAQDKWAEVVACRSTPQKIKLMREFISQYSKNYIPKVSGEDKVGTSTCKILELESKTEDMFIKIARIWVDPKTYLMLKVEQTDINDNVTTYRVLNADFKSKIKDELFKMDTPDEYELIDLR